MSATGEGERRVLLDEEEHDEDEEHAEHEEDNAEEAGEGEEETAPAPEDTAGERSVPRWIVFAALFVVVALAGLGIAMWLNSGDVESNVVSSPHDNREYRVVKLSNGLEVALVSDPQADEAGAAVDVQVGSWNDPPDFEGLAHFCEHMLFLGTKEFPEESGFRSFLSNHGGSTNAYTSNEHTNYYFRIDTPALPEALSRFAGFFIQPSLSRASMDREILAVHSEHQKNKQSDDWRLSQLLFHATNQGLPPARFSTGDLSTLNHTGLHEALVDFHRAYYVASRMRVSVVSRESLEDMAEWVKSAFSGLRGSSSSSERESAGSTSSDRSPVNEQTPVIPGHWSPQDLAPDAVLPANLRGRRYCFEPVKEGYSVQWFWALPSQQTLFRSQPAAFVGWLLGDESVGSLSQVIREDELAFEIQAGLEEDAQGFSFFSVSMELNPAKVNQAPSAWEDVVQQAGELLFAAIRMHSAQLQKRLWSERRQASKADFLFPARSDPDSFASELASRLHISGPTDLLDPPDRWQWRPTQVMNVLHSLDPRDCVVVVSLTEGPAQLPPRTLVEPVYKTRYSNQPLPDEWLSAWKNPEEDHRLHLPPKNPYLTDDFSLVPLPEGIGPFDKDEPYIPAAWHMTEEEAASMVETVKERHGSERSDSLREFVGAASPVFLELEKDDSLRVNHRNRIASRRGRRLNGAHTRFVATKTLSKATESENNDGEKNATRLPIDVWWRVDETFRQPIAVAFLQLSSERLRATDAGSVVKAAVWLRIIAESLEAESYMANKAGLRYMLDRSAGGGAIEIGVAGLSEPLLGWWDSVLHAVRHTEITEDALQRAQAALSVQWTNERENSAVYSFALRLARQWVSPDQPTLRAQVKRLKELTLSSLKTFVDEVHSSARGVVFVHGNVDGGDAAMFASSVSRAWPNIKPRSGASGELAAAAWEPQAWQGAWRVQKRVPNLDEKESCSVLGADWDWERGCRAAEEGSWNSSACLERMLQAALLERALEPIAFDVLRTKQQLGYIVFSGRVSLGTWHSLSAFFGQQQRHLLSSQRVRATALAGSQGRHAELEQALGAEAAAGRVRGDVYRLWVLLVQGSRGADELSMRMEDFVMTEAVDALAGIDKPLAADEGAEGDESGETPWNGLTRALGTELLAKPRMIEDAARQLWGEISSGQFSWDRRAQLLRILPKVEPNDVVQWFKDSIAGEDASLVSVEAWGSKGPWPARPKTKLGVKEFERVEAGHPRASALD